MKKLLTFLSILTIASCTEVMVVIPDEVIVDTDRVILIEELTGVRCPNCPKGSKKLEEIINKYPENVIGVAIHSDFLADPYPESKYDFRSDLADDLGDYLLPYQGKPAGAFNRTQIPSEEFLSLTDFDAWGFFALQEISKPHVLDLDIEVNYDSAIRQLDIEVTANSVTDIAGDIRISVMLTESHIIDPQLDVEDVIINYEHNHVLRSMLTSFDGNFFANELTTGEDVITNFSATIPPEDGLWVADNMEVVAYVSLVTPETKEVLQAVQAHVVE